MLHRPPLRLNDIPRDNISETIVVRTKFYAARGFADCLNITRGRA